MCIFLLFSAAFAQNQYSLPSGEVDLVDLTRQISKITGFSFLHGPNFKGKANLVINHQVDAKEAFEIYLSVLSANGYTTIEKGQVIKIVPKGEGPDPNLTFLKGEPVGPSDQRITVFIELSNISATEAADALKPLLGKEGKIVPSPVGNRLIVVDDGANVDRIRKTVAAMDREGAKMKIEVVPLKQAGAATVADILSRLFPEVGKNRGTSFGKNFSAVPDLRTNSIIIKAPDEERAAAKKLLNKLDDPENSAGITVEYLRHATAQDLSQVLEELK